MQKKYFSLKNIFFLGKQKPYTHRLWHSTGCGRHPRVSKIANFMFLSQNQWKSCFFMKIGDFHDQARLHHTCRVVQSAEKYFFVKKILGKLKPYTHRFWHSTGCGRHPKVHKIANFMIFRISIEIWHNNYLLFWQTHTETTKWAASRNWYSIRVDVCPMNRNDIQISNKSFGQLLRS